MTSRRRRDCGFALFSVLLVLVLLASMAAGALTLSSIDLRSTTHFRTGRQAFYAAESGVAHALAVINGHGVTSFQTDIAASTAWTQLFGASTKALASDPLSTYTIAVAASGTDPANRGVVTSTGTAPMEALRVIQVALRKGAIADQGALYLANDNVTPAFGGRDQFLIDGNDHTITNALNPSGPQRPGIATRNDGVTQAATDTLSDPQKMRVQGLDFSLAPLKPSIKTTGGPSVSDLDNLIQRLLANPGVVTTNDAVLNAGVYGTLDSPQITHLTNRNVTMNGNLQGVGILIADGEVTINGSANFIGWMIIRGPTIVRSVDDETLVDGNSVILGSLWTGDLEVQVGGSAVVNYCQACMQLVDGIGGGGNLPRMMAVASWQEVI